MVYNVQTGVNIVYKPRDNQTFRVGDYGKLWCTMYRQGYALCTNRGTNRTSRVGDYGKLLCTVYRQE